MDAIGVMDMSYTDVDDVERVRRLPSPQLVGTPERATIDLNSLSNAGVELVGRLVTLREGKAQFSGSLANLCSLADAARSGVACPLPKPAAASLCSTTQD